jgi:hypothetical protein
MNDEPRRLHNSPLHWYASPGAILWRSLKTLCVICQHISIERFMPVFLFLLAIIVLIHPASTFAYDFSSWREIPANGPSAAHVTGHAGVADYSSDAALFFGGHHGDSSQPTDDIWRFSFHGKSWEKMHSNSSNPSSRYNHCGTTCISDSESRALFFGGAMGNGSLLNDVWALKFGLSSTWQKYSPSSNVEPSPRTHSACACLDATALIVFGGRDFRGANNELWMMNLFTMEWIFLQSSSTLKPVSSFGSCIFALGTSTFFVFGGFDSDNSALNDAWVIHVNTTQSLQPEVAWQMLEARSNPPARGFHSCISSNAMSDNFYILGGIGSGDPRNDNMLQDMWTCTIVSKAEAHDFKCRSLVFASPMPLCSQCIYVMLANIILVHGGLRVGGEISGETTLLHLSDMKIYNVMHSGQEAPMARSGAVILHFFNTDGMKYLFLHGGSDQNNMLLSDTWLHDISSGR